MEPFNDDITNLASPTMPFDSEVDRVVEYTHMDESDDPTRHNHDLDRVWSPTEDGYWYMCRGIVANAKGETDLERYGKYRSSILVDGNSLSFFGGTERFALYDVALDSSTSHVLENAHVLVTLKEDEFTQLLFSDSELTTYFIRWLYWQVTHEPPEEGTTRGEWYLFHNHKAFNDAIAGILSGPFENVHHTTASTSINSRFDSI